MQSGSAMTDKAVAKPEDAPASPWSVRNADVIITSLTVLPASTYAAFKYIESAKPGGFGSACCTISSDADQEVTFHRILDRGFEQINEIVTCINSCPGLVKFQSRLGIIVASKNRDGMDPKDLTAWRFVRTGRAVDYQKLTQRLSSLKLGGSHSVEHLMKLLSTGAETGFVFRFKSIEQLMELNEMTLALMKDDEVIGVLDKTCP
jgi:hypothetical protein